MSTTSLRLAIVIGGLLAMHCGPTSPGGVGGAGGTGGAGGSGGSGGSGGGEAPTMLPTAVGTCPTLHTGTNAITLNGKSMNWDLWVGSKSAGPGPIVIYWHATGSNSSEVNAGFGSSRIQEVVDAGGLVASPQATSATGSNTGNNVWYRGDFAYADQIVACAIQQLNIDTKHIHTMGYSAGGLQTTAMAYDRSGYLASVASYSGGLLFPNNQQDPNYLPPAVVTHGAQGSDVVIIDFYDASHAWEDAMTAQGVFSIDCNDGEGHVSGTRLGLAPEIWQFFKDHPYKVEPDPYAGGLPGGWPSYCHIVQ